MQIDKEAILNLLRERGDEDKAKQAEDQLPDQVDTERHADLLERLAIGSGRARRSARRRKDPRPVGG